MPDLNAMKAALERQGFTGVEISTDQAEDERVNGQWKASVTKDGNRQQIMINEQGTIVTSQGPQTRTA